MTQSSPGTTGRIEKRVLIKATPAIVYRALTDAHELVRWFCDRASSDPKIGGELTAFWRTGKTGQRGRAVYTRLEPDTMVELVWVDEGSGPAPDDSRHTLVYKIRRRRRDTEVTMQDEDQRSRDAEFFAALDEGWNTVLLELKDFCERKERSGKGRPHPEE